MSWTVGSTQIRLVGAVLLCGLALAIAGAAVATAGVGGRGMGAEAIPGSVPRLVSVARPLGPLNPARRIRIALPLALPHLPALNSYLAAEYTPGTPEYRAFLTPAEFGARFGAPADELHAAVGALKRLGLSVAPTSPNHLYVSAVGTVGALDRDFGVRLENFSLGAGGGLLAEHRFYANTDLIRLPASLHGLATGVIGLDDSSRPESQLRSVRRPASLSRRTNLHATGAKAPVGVHGGATPCQQANASGGYTAPDLAQGYDFNGAYAKGFHGEGMSAALVEFDDFHVSNVVAMESCYKVKTRVSRRPVDGGVGGPPGSGEAEDMADITTVLELDPKLAHLYVYEAPITGGAALLDEGTSELDLYSTYVNDDRAPVLSSSWGNCEETQSASYDQLFARIAEEAAVQGQQILDASGDSGAVDCRGFPAPSLGSLSVEQEAAIPWITGVGGTDLGQDSTEATSGIHDEDTWNDGGAGGGGQSNVWAMPSWQASYLKAAHDKVADAANDCGAPKGQLCRMVPDIAMNADPDAGGALNGGPVPPQFSTSVPPDVGSPGDNTYCATTNCSFASLVGAPGVPVGKQPPAGAGGWYPIGGTSLATPTAAAAAVLWDQEAKHAGLGSFGFLNPSLYRIASSAAAYKHDFHDVTVDTNDDQYDATDCPTGCNPHHLYPAGKGYDMASGLGSVDVANIGAALIKQATNVAVTPSTEQMYGYLRGPRTTQPVSVTSGYRHSRFTASSTAAWLHVRRSGKVPGTLSWFVTPKGLSSGTRKARIKITGKNGSIATLSVTYAVGPRAKIKVSPGKLQFAEGAINSKGQPTTPTCGSTTWNDELKESGSSLDKNSRRTLLITNGGAHGSTLHYEVSFHTFTSSWLTEDLNPKSNPTGFRTRPSGPLVPTAGAVKSGSSAKFKLASIANANAAGGYPPMNQGTYKGVVEVRDLADPSVLVRVPAVLVLGNGKHTPTVSSKPRAFRVVLAPGKSRKVDLVLGDASRRCGYAYSLESTRHWLFFSYDLQSGTVGASPAKSPPKAVTDTGKGNGFTPLTISAAHLRDGIHHAILIVDSQNAVGTPAKVPVTLIVGSVPHRKHHKRHKHGARQRAAFTG